VEQGSRLRADPERILHEWGVGQLEKTGEGRVVLSNLRKRYEKELLQPSDPRFLKEYGKEIRERAEMKRENERISKEMWAERR